MMDRQVACGVTTSIVESQELSYIVGPRGARVFLDEAEHLAGRLLYTVSGLMTNDPEQDSRLRPDDWIPLLDHPRAAGVGEIYWADLLRGHPRTEALVDAALGRGMAVEGHGAGARLAVVDALAAAGVGSDHEGISAEDVLTRLRVGLVAFARHGATRQDLPAVAPLLHDHHLDLSRVGLVCDGVEPDALERGDSLNSVVEQAVELGVPLARAVRMASRTVTDHFGLGRWLGGLGPAMLADLAVLPRNGGFRPRLVLVGGRRPAPSRPSSYPAWMLETIRLPGLRPELLARPPLGRWRAIEFRGPLVTQEVESDGQSDLVCTVVDRTGGTRGFRGLLRGFGLQGGGAAVSSGWECPGILVVGDDLGDMAIAARRLEELRGGAVVTSGRRVLAEFPAPVAGLYSTEPLGTVVSQVAAVNRSMRELGCVMPNPILSLEVLTTAAIPFFRIWAGGYRRLKDGALVGLEWD
jgi:adenine deaminase